MKTARNEKGRPEPFFAQDEVKRLHKFVRERLAYHEAIGDLNPGNVAAEDIVGNVLLHAYREYAKQSASELGNVVHARGMGPWLEELAIKQIQQNIDRLQALRSRGIALQQDIPEIPPEEAISTLGEEILYFYQPDEDLRIEDIYPDMNISTPEEFVAAKEELLRCVNMALGSMPIQWRRALRLRYAGGLTSEQLSEVLEEDVPNVERVLEYARRHLRQTLEAAGCTFIGKAAGSSSS